MEPERNSQHGEKPRRVAKYVGRRKESGKWNPRKKGLTRTILQIVYPHAHNIVANVNVLMAQIEIIG